MEQGSKVKSTQKVRDQRRMEANERLKRYKRMKSKEFAIRMRIALTYAHI